jgi:DNA polymerase-1
MDGSIKFGKDNGYVQTLMGRKRWLKDINSANFTIRGFAERNAINSPIQGTAADMIKLAMIKIDAAFVQHQFKSKMILQVHDELVFDVLKEELEKVKPVILECMQHALLLPNEVPIFSAAALNTSLLLVFVPPSVIKLNSNDSMPSSFFT